MSKRRVKSHHKNGLRKGMQEKKDGGKGERRTKVQTGTTSSTCSPV